MTPDHSKALAELKQEGRRWVLRPAKDENGIYRAEAVFENYPCRFPLGTVSNHPDATPPLTFGTNEDEAEEAAIKWNDKRGITRQEYFRIIASSVGEQTKLQRIKLKRDPHSSVSVLYDGNGYQLLTLDEDAARSLYQQIARAYYWTHDEFCKHCGQVFERGVCPDGCEEEAD